MKKEPKQQNTETRTMKKTMYERRYLEPNKDWEPVSIEQVIKDTEDAGYWKKGTVKEMLDDGQIIFTSWAVYRRIKDND